MTTLRMTCWAPRRPRFADFAAWRFLEPVDESSDLSGAWPHTDTTLRKGIARGRDDGGLIRRLCSCVPENVLSLITQMILQFNRDGGDGPCHVFVPHATAGVALIETGSGSDPTSRTPSTGCCPAMTFTSTGTAAAVTAETTVLAAFVSPSLTVPVLGGRPTFGTWQSVVLVDTNADNPDRKVRLSFIPG
jgi:thiamine phosphate synthase YjbQ (UPF0047 family)